MHTQVDVYTWRCEQEATILQEDTVVAQHKYLQAKWEYTTSGCTQTYLHIIEAKWMHIIMGCTSAQIIEAESGTENMQDIRMPKIFIESRI